VAFVFGPASANVMGEYPAYLINKDGRIYLRVDLDFPDDEAAKAHAEQLVDAHDVELWQFGRKIETFRIK
jgi:hypothetical protein